MINEEKKVQVKLHKDTTGAFINVKGGKHYIGQCRVSLRQDIKATCKRLGISKKRYRALGKIERRKQKEEREAKK